MDEQEPVKAGRCIHCQRVLVREDEELCWRCRLEQTRATLEQLRSLLHENGRSESPAEVADEYRAGDRKQDGEGNSA